jgi:hypothetical protein
MLVAVVVLAEPVALVLEKSGKTIPDLQPYSEIQNNTGVALPAGGKLVFMHYRTCETVTVSGGAVKFSGQGFDLAGTASKSVVKGTCSRKVKCTSQGGCEMAGAMLRGGSTRGGEERLVRVESVAVSAYPTFLLIGKRGEDFASVRVAKEGKTILEAALEGRQFVWPSSAAPLVPDATYELTLMPRSKEGEPVTVKILTMVPDVKPDQGELLVLRVE